VHATWKEERYNSLRLTAWNQTVLWGEMFLPMITEIILIQLHGYFLILCT
jgi:hypothetical protein